MSIRPWKSHEKRYQTIAEQLAEVGMAVVPCDTAKAAQAFAVAARYRYREGRAAGTIEVSKDGTDVVVRTVTS